MITKIFINTLPQVKECKPITPNLLHTNSNCSMSSAFVKMSTNCISIET